MISILRIALIGSLILPIAYLSAGGFPSPNIPVLLNEQPSPPVHLIKRKKSRKPSPTLVKNLRYHAHPTYTRLVFDLPARVTFKEKIQRKSKKVIISLHHATLSKKAKRKLKEKNFPKGVHITKANKHTINVTLDFKVIKSYKLRSFKKPHRLVLDIYNHQGKKRSTKRTVKAAPQSPKTAKAVIPPPPATKRPQDLLIVIDPGHGGKDPGALGKKGTKEKTITLKISKKLRELIRKRIGARVLLTREKDKFLELEERVEIANSKKADVFISIHVNSHPKKSIRGLEVYHFGKASDPRALEVAARENGTPLGDNAPAWQFILADKLTDQKIDESRDFAWTTRASLVARLRKHYQIKDHGVKTAPFYVLRFTTMPGILAEVAFVSNPTEENRLRSKTYQNRMAEGIFDGINAYIKNGLLSLS